MKKENGFVYVVCGGDKHINTLNTSIKYLKRFSKNKIIVITDSSRNQIKIAHDLIIDIKTDSKYTHHQAAIFLKTSVHKYLDMDNALYCYLDSDVIALSEEVDEVFNQTFDTIGFCPDNITFDYFSPYAMNCSCIDESIQNREKLMRTSEEYDKLHGEWSSFIKENGGTVLNDKLEKIKKPLPENWGKLVWFQIQKTLPFCKTIRLFDHLMDKKSKQWKNKEGKVVLYPVESYESFIHSHTGFVYHKNDNFWSKADDPYDVTIPRCGHLHKAISETFGVNISPVYWQHPNGGVFLFDAGSSDFLNFWHENTIEIFSNSTWKIRDQGTLAYAFWNFSLQKRSYLPKEFNFIADYYSKNSVLDYDGTFNINGRKIKPHFIHIFHHWDDKDWPVWNSILSFLHK